MEKEHTPSQWPPAPDFGSDDDREWDGEEDETRLLTGTVWGDILGSFISLVSLTLLTFIFFNPIAASILPKEPSSLFRLLAGWSVAGVVQFIGWRLLRRRHYVFLCEGVVGASLLAGLVWLLLIILACWLFG